MPRAVARKAVGGERGMDGRSVDLAVLDEIQRRVLWLAIRMVDAANHDRGPGEVKVGGHQASSASVVSIMTALWFSYLKRGDRISVKPHASPVYHAIQYLLGNLDRTYLTQLRAFGGLQAYPSRTKDPDGVDFSTGSVGLGAVAPLFAAVTRRYVDAHFGPRPRSRFIAVVGDAELDEGNVWEAVADPVTAGLRDVLWIVDLNRQSLDRVVPGVRIEQLKAPFRAAGWNVLEAKWGRRLEGLGDVAGGRYVRGWLDAMSNEQYQSLFALSGGELRERFLDGAGGEVSGAVSRLDDEELRAVISDLGGHDLDTLRNVLSRAEASASVPTVIFAYTIKGWGTVLAGHPRNHSALLTSEQVSAMRGELGLDVETEWDRFEPSSPAGLLCAQRARELCGEDSSSSSTIKVPLSSEVRFAERCSTQEAFGRIVVELSREKEVAPHLVTVAPDVATSTNLAGYINRAGVFAASKSREWPTDGLLRWSESEQGHHIELGISEMNLFLLLGQLGLAGDYCGEALLPIGTVYDPFVCRGLDAFIYSVYSGSRFIVAGTPSGVTLAPEGGAHQSTITAGIGVELPNCTFSEPAYAKALDWLLCDALRSVGDASEASQAFYFRLSTRPIDQDPFEAARKRVGDEVLRRQVLAGGYRLEDGSVEGHGKVREGSPVVHIAACGAVVPEALAAARALRGEGVVVHVVDVTSLGRLYRSWQASVRRSVREACAPVIGGVLADCFPERAPVVTVHDAGSHAMAWLGSALGVPAVALGVDEFGQSGGVADLYRVHDLLPEAITNAALAAVARMEGDEWVKGFG